MSTLLVYDWNFKDVGKGGWSGGHYIVCRPRLRCNFPLKLPVSADEILKAGEMFKHRETLATVILEGSSAILHPVVTKHNCPG